MEITPKFNFVSGSFDTDEVSMLCIPQKNHGTVELCIKEKDCGWNIPVGKIKLHSNDLYKDFAETFEDASNLGHEIARRWNEHEEWVDASSERLPEINTQCVLRVEYYDEEADKTLVDYLTAEWNHFGWSEDYLDQIADYYSHYQITHWKPISKPKGVTK